MARNFRLLEYRAQDTRLILRLLAALVAWQLLSTDYSSLAVLAGGEGPMVLPPCLQWTVFFESHGLQSEHVVIGLQWMGVVALTVGTWWLRRSWVAGAIPVAECQWCP